MRYPRLGYYGTRLKSPAKEIETARTGHYCFATSVRDPKSVIEPIRECVDEVAFEWMPQWLPVDPGAFEPWNLNHIASRAVNDLDAWLRGPDGKILRTWGYGIVDFSRKDVVTRLIDLVLDWIAGRGPRDYNAMVLEVFAERLWAGWLPGKLRPDDVVDQEQWEAESRRFVRGIADEIVVIAGGDGSGVPNELIDGTKIEDWFWRVGGRSPSSWVSDFLGRGTRRGYLLAESQCGDSLHTLLDLEYHSARVIDDTRLLVATASLLDGIALYSPNPEDLEAPPGPYGIPFAGEDWGAPRGRFEVLEDQTGVLTYRREFELMTVEVRVGSFVSCEFRRWTEPPVIDPESPKDAWWAMYLAAGGPGSLGSFTLLTRLLGMIPDDVYRKALGAKEDR